MAKSEERGEEPHAPSSRFATRDSRVVVIQTAFLGDVVLTTGLLTSLAERFGPVDLVTTRAAAGLLEGHPAVRRVLIYDKRGGDRGIGGLVRTARELRSAGYARAYLPHRSLRSAALALLARIPERIGYAGSPGALAYTRAVPRPAAGHEAERILALAGPELGGAPARVALGLTARDRTEAADWLAAHGVAEPFVAMAPGSIWGTKRWPGYAELAARIPEPVVIIGGPEDRALAEAIAAAAPGRVQVAAGALSLRGSAALLERARVLVTNDSAPLHLGSAVGTPIVAIFGPTIPGFGFGPRGEADRIIELTGLPCRPCSSHGPEVCPLGHHKCMREIRIDDVVVAVRGER